jgi:hypothetical protein
MASRSATAAFSMPLARGHRVAEDVSLRPSGRSQIGIALAAGSSPAGRGSRLHRDRSASFSRTATSSLRLRRSVPLGGRRRLSWATTTMPPCGRSRRPLLPAACASA